MISIDEALLIAGAGALILFSGVLQKAGSDLWDKIKQWLDDWWDERGQ